MAQAAFAVGPSRLQSRLLARQQQFDTLFEGYDRLQSLEGADVEPIFAVDLPDRRLQDSGSRGVWRC